MDEITVIRMFSVGVVLFGVGVLVAGIAVAVLLLVRAWAAIHSWRYLESWQDVDDEDGYWSELDELERKRDGNRQD